jgi:hypothetical protein
MLPFRKHGADGSPQTILPFWLFLPFKFLKPVFSTTIVANGAKVSWSYKQTFIRYTYTYAERFCLVQTVSINIRNMATLLFSFQPYHRAAFFRAG